MMEFTKIAVLSGVNVKIDIKFQVSYPFSTYVISNIVLTASCPVKSQTSVAAISLKIVLPSIVKNTKLAVTPDKSKFVNCH